MGIVTCFPGYFLFPPPPPTHNLGTKVLPVQDGLWKPATLLPEKTDTHPTWEVKTRLVRQSGHWLAWKAGACSSVEPVGSRDEPSRKLLACSAMSLCWRFQRSLTKVAARAEGWEPVTEIYRQNESRMGSGNFFFSYQKLWLMCFVFCCYNRIHETGRFIKKEHFAHGSGGREVECRWVATTAEAACYDMLQNRGACECSNPAVWRRRGGSKRFRALYNNMLIWKRIHSQGQS